MQDHPNIASFPPPKLRLISQLFWPELISTGQVLTQLCETLSAMGVEIEVLCGPPTVVSAEVPVQRVMQHQGIRIERVWGTRFPKLNFAGKLANQLSFASSVFQRIIALPTDRPAIVLTEPPFLGLFCALANLLRGQRFIYLIFDLYPDAAIANGVLRESDPLAQLWRQVNRLIFQRASRIVVIGRCMRAAVERQLDAAERHKLVQIHMWTDDQRIQPLPKTASPFVQRWGLDGKFVVLYAGNMGRVHDLETIMAAAKALATHPTIRFVFVGEGHKKRWAMDFAETHHLTNCRFEKLLPRADVPYSLSAADVGLVSLAAGQEAFSVPSKTYGLMAAGKPAIAVMSPGSEIAQMLSEEQCGLVVPPGDVDALVTAIDGLAADTDRLAAMGQRARQAIDTRYSLQHAAERYLELIRSVDDS